jgi:hypothetical protein
LRFKPATYEQTTGVSAGRQIFQEIGCAQCHIPDLQIIRDRRVADLETVYDSENGIFNNLFGTAGALFTAQDDGSGFPTLKQPANQPFLI